MSDATDVLTAIDQLRRDLSGYHGQLKAHNDLQRHCDNQRNRIVELEGLYAEAKSENAKLRRKLEILRDHGIEIVDAVAGGFEIYSKDHELADRLKWLVERYHSAMRCMLETGTSPTDPAFLEDRMREIGMEVDTDGCHGGEVAVSTEGVALPRP